MFVSGFIFSQFSAFGGEESLFRTFVFIKFSAFDTLSDQGNNVALPLLQFVDPFRRSPAHPLTRRFRPGRHGPRFSSNCSSLKHGRCQEENAAWLKRPSGRSLRPAGSGEKTGVGTRGTDPAEAAIVCGALCASCTMNFRAQSETSPAREISAPTNLHVEPA